MLHTAPHVLCSGVVDVTLPVEKDADLSSSGVNLNTFLIHSIWCDRASLHVYVVLNWQDIEFLCRA